MMKMNTLRLIERDTKRNSEAVVSIQWRERKMEKQGRIGAMYCFKNCDKNQN